MLSGLRWRTRAAYRKTVVKHDLSVGRRHSLDTPMQAARRFSEDACASLPRIRVSEESAARDVGGGSAHSPSDTVDAEDAGPSTEEYCLDFLETEMEIVQMHAKRATSYRRLRPYLNRLIAVLNQIESPRAHHHAVVMLSRFNEETVVGDTRVGVWLRRAFEERQRISDTVMKEDPFGRPHADIPCAGP